MREPLGDTHPVRSGYLLRGTARLLLLAGAAAVAYVLLSLLSGPAQAGPAEDVEPGREMEEPAGRGLLDVPLAEDVLSTVLGSDDPPDGPPAAPDDAGSGPPPDPAESPGEADQADPPVTGPSHGDPESGSDAPAEPEPTAAHGTGEWRTGESERTGDREPVAPLPAVDLLPGPKLAGPDSASSEQTALTAGDGHQGGPVLRLGVGSGEPALAQVRLDVTESVEQLVTVVDPVTDPLVDVADLVDTVDSVVAPLDSALVPVDITVTGGDPVGSGPVAVEPLVDPPLLQRPAVPTGAGAGVASRLGPVVSDASAPHRRSAGTPARSVDDSDRDTGRDHDRAPGSSLPVGWPTQSAGAGQDSGKPWPWVGSAPSAPSAGACRPVVRGCAVPPDRAVPVAVSPG